MNKGERIKKVSTKQVLKVLKIQNFQLSSPTLQRNWDTW